MRSAEAPTLFDAASERLALASGRPKSQERADLFPVQTAGAGFRCLKDHPLRYSKKRGLVCPVCDVAS